MSEIRSMRPGEWFWMDRYVIHGIASELGSTSIAVYTVLASMANRHQRCFPAQAYIARRLGCSPSTVSRALKRLSKSGLLRIERRQRLSLYELLRVRSCAGESQIRHQRTSDLAPVHTNKNQLTRIHNQMGTRKKSLLLGKGSGRSTEETERTRLLAYDLASGLGDLPNLDRYRMIAERYPEQRLRACLSEARSIPDARLMRNRAAVFASMLRNHGV